MTDTTILLLLYFLLWLMMDMMMGGGVLGSRGHKESSHGLTKKKSRAVSIVSFGSGFLSVVQVDDTIVRFPFYQCQELSRSYDPDFCNYFSLRIQ